MKRNRPEDIWRRIDQSGPTECWPYTGSTFNGRYGRFFLDGEAVLAHRVVYELCHGAIPSGLYVMHKCNNIICCNPHHLVIGSNSENQRHASCSGAWQTGITGLTGVGFDKRRGYWTASGYLNGKRRNLYTGPHRDKAVAARYQWEQENGIHF